MVSSSEPTPPVLPLDAPTPAISANDEKNVQTSSAGEGSPAESSSYCKRFFKCIIAFYHTYDFPILILSAILLARIYPPLGADYLQPDITANWLAVALLFTVAGMGLRTSEFAQAFKRLPFNLFVQSYNFFFVSAAVYAISRGLVAANMLSTPLGDGMVICGCLPMAINSLVVMTAVADGDEASAIFNSAFGNMIGIFLSPVLILLYLGSSGDISLGEVFYKLTLKVIVPLIVGQILQKFVPSARAFYLKYKRFFKKFQEFCLIYIVYTVFCFTFESDKESDFGSIFLMIFYQLVLMLLFMLVAWYALKFLFRDQPKLHAMGVFGCSQKTVALGVPLVASIYPNNPNLAAYSLPILIWQPMQLVVGSIVAPRIAKYVEAEQRRLKADEGESQQTQTQGDLEANESEDDDRDSQQDDQAKDKVATETTPSTSFVDK